MGLGELRAPSYLDRNHLETPTDLVRPSHPLLLQLFRHFFHRRTDSDSVKRIITANQQPSSSKRSLNVSGRFINSFSMARKEMTFLEDQ